MAITFGVNKSPFGGKVGKHLTSRQIRDRLTKELETNVALRVEDTADADTVLVSGRGLLHLTVLIETMRRRMARLASSRRHARPPRAPRGASEGVGPPSAPGRRGPSSQIPPSSRGIGARPHQSRPSRRV